MIDQQIAYFIQKQNDNKEIEKRKLQVYERLQKKIDAENMDRYGVQLPKDWTYETHIKEKEPYIPPHLKHLMPNQNLTDSSKNSESEEKPIKKVPVKKDTTKTSNKKNIVKNKSSNDSNQNITINNYVVKNEPIKNEIAVVIKDEPPKNKQRKYTLEELRKYRVDGLKELCVTNNISVKKGMVRTDFETALMLL